MEIPIKEILIGIGVTGIVGVSTYMAYKSYRDTKEYQDEILKMEREKTENSRNIIKLIAGIPMETMSKDPQQANVCKMLQTELFNAETGTIKDPAKLLGMLSFSKPVEEKPAAPVTMTPEMLAVVQQAVAAALANQPSVTLPSVGVAGLATA
jgi:hypothetical protein